MNTTSKIKKICPNLNHKCIQRVKHECPNLDDECLSQMDYMLVGKENYDKESMTHDKYFDREYLKLGKDILDNGADIYNKRTGKYCRTKIGGMLQFDLSDTESFPILTTKKMFYKPMIGELLGFIRGYESAQDFRKLGCNIWDKNANKTSQWINNTNRKGTDDLGRIYGVQAREWITKWHTSIDQLKTQIDKINDRIDDRRLVVTHWNPGELHEMALPPCHMMYMFSIVNDTLHLSMYQRSADYPLGVPFNIASYSLLLKLIAQITDLKCGSFTHFMHNMHIYEDQLELFDEQLNRTPLPSPKLKISESIKTLSDLETWVIPDNFNLMNYSHHDAIKFPFAE